MKKIKYLMAPMMAISLAPIIASPLALTSCSKDDNWKLTNPDGSLVVNIDLSDEGQLSYSVEKNNKAIVNHSILGMSFTEGKKTYDFSKGLTYVKTADHEKEFSYDCRSGKVSHVDVHYKEKVITTRIDDLFMDVTFRTLNDGYGFQYSFYKEDKQNEILTWQNEFSEFNIPTNSMTYGQDYDTSRPYYSYETHYEVRPFNYITADKQISMPFSYEANGYYSMITESGLIGSGYHGSFLKKNDNGVLKTIHAPACGSAPDYTVSLPFTSPWRVSSVGSYATTFETTIVDDILGDIDPYLPEGETDPNYYDWVEPGLTSWSWLLHPEDDANYTLQNKYIDLSDKMDWKYVLLDAGWEGNHLPEEKHALIDGAHGKDVKVLAWAHAMDAKFDDDQIEATIDEYKNTWKVDGLKVDFWDGNGGAPHVFQMEDKQTLQRYENLYKLAAKYGLVINCHGCNKPTGERRRFPNLLNREGLRGNEFKTVYAPQDVLLTLTRGVVGPSDFTPVVKPIEHDVTIGFQMAMPIMLESGIPSMADEPTVYIGENGEQTPYTNFYKNLPAAWDRSIFLDGNPQTHVVVARKKGNNWWVGGITSAQRTINLDFSFLDSGNYSAIIYNGGSRAHDDEGDIDITRETVNRKTKKLISVTDNGGFAIELVKQ